jgi:hypothetical protein
MKTFVLLKRFCGISFLLLLISSQTSAQSIERQVIASGGASVTSPIQLDYTIGEIVVTSVTAGSLTLTQGFQQPYFVVIPGNNVFPYLVIYPNPTQGDALARFILPAPARVTVRIYNTISQLMATETVNYQAGEMQYVIKSHRFTPGSYFIHFSVNGSAEISKILIKME